MPTILRTKGYRFFFFSLEGHEPPHIHVEKAEGYAKFWLVPIAVARSRGFRDHELHYIAQLIEQHYDLLKGKWNEYFAG